MYSIWCHREAKVFCHLWGVNPSFCWMCWKQRSHSLGILLWAHPIARILCLVWPSPGMVHHGNCGQDSLSSRKHNAHTSKVRVRKGLIKHFLDLTGTPRTLQVLTKPDKHHLLLLHKLICDELPHFPKEWVPYPDNGENNPWTKIRYSHMGAEAFPNVKETSLAHEAISIKSENNEHRVTRSRQLRSDGSYQGCPKVYLIYQIRTERGHRRKRKQRVQDHFPIHPGQNSGPSPAHPPTPPDHQADAILGPFSLAKG